MPTATATSADVIVLGTGGMGTAACAHLAARGAKVIGLDRFQIAHDRGSSHGQTRLIRQAYFEHPDYVPLLLEAYRLWRGLEEATGTRLLFQSGLLLAGPETGEAVAGALHAAAIHRLPIERLAAGEAKRRWPAFVLDDDFLAVWEPAAGYLLVEECVRAHAEVAKRHGARFEEGPAIARVSAVGAGMACTAGTAARMFRCLADAGINIELIATSEIRTSCVVAEADGVRALQAVHDAFRLGGEIRHQAQGSEAPV
jgi:sarcosine oxidase